MKLVVRDAEGRCVELREKRECAFCGGEFESLYEAQVTCSFECASSKAKSDEGRRGAPKLSVVR